MRFKKIYIEISNICNLNCIFCPGTTRDKRIMSVDEFSVITDKIRPFTEYIYLHVMGEPLCHPEIGKILETAGEKGFKVIITTNGTLLKGLGKTLLSYPSLHKINISLHSFEANDISMLFSDYLTECFGFGRCAEGKKIISFRLWNKGGKDNKNAEIIKEAENYFPRPWDERDSWSRIGEKVYIEYGDMFDWPDLSAKEIAKDVFCYGLKDQLGILCDGTVVPCCLDHEGDISLGNLFNEDLETILDKPRTRAISEGFSRRVAVEELCQKCGYARRF